jgi:hypothetical protein
MFSILQKCKLSIQSLKAADDETLTGAGVDMLGFDSICFVPMALKGEALNFTIKAQQAAVSDFSDAADLLGTSVAFATTVGTDALSGLEIHTPNERYVRPLTVVPDAAVATLVAVLAIQFNAKDIPQTNSGEVHVSPAEGTA